MLTRLCSLFISDAPFLFANVPLPLLLYAKFCDWSCCGDPAGSKAGWTLERGKKEVSALVLLLSCMSACTLAIALNEEDSRGIGAGKFNPNHAPVITGSSHLKSELHQDVVRVLRTVQTYSAFAALLDNMTESVIRQGITIFAPNDGALSDFHKRKTQEHLENLVRFHIITTPLPFSNLLRMEAGSRLKTAVSNFTILVTNTTKDAYQVDDATIIDPDLYTGATIAVHGINAVFNTTKIGEGPLPENPKLGNEAPSETTPGGIVVSGSNSGSGG
ncbi:FAS1 domain-containing protein SELMODRAFT_448915 isoform X2 [Physcomitrium patens]